MTGTIEAKRAAAVAAVFSYLAQRKACAPGTAGAQVGSAGFRQSLWALYGRQALMSQAIRLQARRRG